MRKIIVSMTALLISIISVSALTNDFKINSSNLTISTNSKKNNILENFNKEYNLTYSIKDEENKTEKEIIELTKKTTFLLLGDFNNENETSENYYKRHQEYLQLGAYQTFPIDENTTSGYDETIPNYKHALISTYAVPSMFLEFNDLGIIYSYYGDIRVTINENLIISSITLPNVKIKEESIEDPKKYNIRETNIIITYYFTKINNEYKLFYLFGERSDEINEYFKELENKETKNTMNIIPTYDNNLRQIYDFSELDKITDEEINNIYNKNKDNIVTLNSYYNNYVVATANGFFINDGLVVTTWSFLEKSLSKSQYIVIKNHNGNSYKIEGIVTASPDNDIVVIKLENKVNKKVTLDSSNNLKEELPIFTISSKIGVGLTTLKGIIISNNNYIQTSIPLTTSDEGSPLFNTNGNIIGMNTSKQVNSSISISINSEILKEVQDKFNNIDFETIKTISFEKLKEEFYYIKYNEEIIKNEIPSNKWKKYSKIGNIEENIKLELLKANYEDGIISLRYKNSISEYISGMQLASSFKEQLIKDGFKEILNGSTKCIYENNKYQIIIMDEFDYLIVVMVKL